MKVVAFSSMIALGVVALLALPAAAEQAQPSGDDALARQAYGAAFQVVACASKESPSALRKLIETEMESTEEAKQVSKMQALSRRCAGEMPKLMPLLVRNVSAIMLYNEEFKRVAPSEPTPPLPLPASFAVVPADRQGTDAQQNIWYVASIANCVSWANPVLAREAVLADPDPKSEEKAFGALKPALDQCLPPGAAFPIKPLEFRGILAEQLLKRSRMVKGSGS